MQERPFKVDSGKSPPAASVRKRVRWWLIALIFLGPLVVLWMAWFGFRVGWTLRENNGREQMAASLFELSADGIPIDDEDVLRQYVERTSDEDLEGWYEVFERLQEPSFLADFEGVRYLDPAVDVDEFDNPFPIGDDWAAADKATAATEKHRVTIEQARQLAGAESPVRFPFIFQGTETLLPELQESRAMARLLFCDAQVAVHLGDGERALRDAIALGELSKHAEAIPFGIARIVGIAYRQQALKVIKAGVRTDLFDEKQLHRLDDDCAEHATIGSRWQELMLGEMSVHLGVFTDPSAAMKSASIIPARGHDAVYFIDLMQRASEIDVADFLALHQASESLLVEVDEGPDSWLEKADRILSRLLAPPFASYAEMLINDCLQHRLARLAIACRLFEKRYQKLPDRADEIPEELISLEPLRGQRFGFLRTEEGITVWGLHLSSEVKKITEQIPETEGATVEFLNNRSVIWTLDD